MALGKLPVSRRPTNLGTSRTRAYCACSRCGMGLFGQFSSSITSLFFLPRSGGRLDIDLNSLKGSLNPKQPTNLSEKMAEKHGGVHVHSKKGLAWLGLEPETSIQAIIHYDH